MKNHEHYYHWTIEWEQRDDDCPEFWIRRKVIEPYLGTESVLNTYMGHRGDLESAIDECKSIIDDIINQQNTIADKLLNIA